jgi:8-oxo-dGTP diphosphatase
VAFHRHPEQPAGRSPRAAPAREIAEELGCIVEVGEVVTSTSHEYDFAVVSLTTFWCRLAQGAPDLTEHAGITWLAPAELERNDFLR